MEHKKRIRHLVAQILLEDRSRKEWEDRLHDFMSNPEKQKMISGKYANRIAVNMEFMESNLSEWSAVPVSGMSLENTPVGDRMLPTFEFPKGYSSAPTLFVDEECGLCGTRIKNVYWIQNDKKRWVLGVGSECITHFGEGKSGEKIAKESVTKNNRNVLLKLHDARRSIYNVFYVSYMGDYGRTNYRWTDRKAEEIYKEIRSILGNFDPQESSDAMVNRTMNKKGVEAKQALDTFETFFQSPQAIEQRKKSIRKKMKGSQDQFDKFKPTNPLAIQRHEEWMKQMKDELEALDQMT